MLFFYFSIMIRPEILKFVSWVLESVKDTKKGMKCPRIN